MDQIWKKLKWYAANESENLVQCCSTTKLVEIQSRKFQLITWSCWWRDRNQSLVQDCSQEEDRYQNRVQKWSHRSVRWRIDKDTRYGSCSGNFKICWSCWSDVDHRHCGPCNISSHSVMSQGVHCGPCNISSHSGHRNSDVSGVLSDGEQRDETDGAVLMRVPSREVDVRHS